MHELAYGYGMRLMDCAGPCPTMPGFDKAFARTGIAEQLGDKDLSDFVLVTRGVLHFDGVGGEARDSP